MPPPIEYNGAQVDLSPRFSFTNTVAASPSAATETIIATLTLDGDVGTLEGVLLQGFAAFTVGASGTAVNLRIRQTDASGTVIKATGATTATAANLGALSIAGVDASPPAAGVYVLTMTVTAGAATSTVSAVCLAAIRV